MKALKKISIVVMITFMLAALTQPVLASKGKVNINTAAKKELVTLKHVGDKIADRIIEYRKAHPFQKPEDIMKVKGVGPKVYDANKDLIVVKDK